MGLNHRPQPYKGCALTPELWARMDRITSCMGIIPMFIENFKGCQKQSKLVVLEHYELESKTIF